MPGMGSLEKGNWIGKQEPNEEEALIQGKLYFVLKTGGTDAI